MADIIAIMFSKKWICHVLEPNISVSHRVRPAVHRDGHSINECSLCVASRRPSFFDKSCGGSRCVSFRFGDILQVAPSHFLIGGQPISLRVCHVTKPNKFIVSHRAQPDVRHGRYSIYECARGMASRPPPLFDRAFEGHRRIYVCGRDIHQVVPGHF